MDTILSTFVKFKLGEYFVLLLRVVSDTYLMTLQYKILHRVYACNEQLHIWKKIELPLYKYYSNHKNLEHFSFIFVRLDISGKKLASGCHKKSHMPSM